jgi:hypothetical protein
MREKNNAAAKNDRSIRPMKLLQAKPNRQNLADMATSFPDDTERERYKAEAAHYRDRFKSNSFIAITILVTLL